MLKASVAGIGLALVVSLSACKTVRDADRIGEGPLRLSPQVAEGFARYKIAYRSGYFAVSQDGRSAGAFACGINFDACWGAITAQKAIEQCEKRSGGQPCYTFAIDQQIVWRDYEDPVPTETRQSHPSRPADTSPSVAQVGFDNLPIEGDVRNFAIYWEDVYGALVGRIALSHQATGPIRIDLPDGGTCTGTYALQGGSGTWSIACDNGKAASGNLTALGAGRGSEGRGRDAEGNRLEFRVTARQG